MNHLSGIISGFFLEKTPAGAKNAQIIHYGCGGRAGRRPFDRESTGLIINKSKATDGFKSQRPSRGSMMNAKMTRAEKAMTPSVMKNVSMTCSPSDWFASSTRRYTPRPKCAHQTL